MKPTGRTRRAEAQPASSDHAAASPVRPCPSSLPTLAWIAWVLMVMTVALSTTNLLYLSIVLLCVLLVGALAPRTGAGAAGFRALLVLGASLFAISLGIAVVNGNYGSHVLFTLPGPEVPGWLGGLRFGGPVTGEGLVAATTRGLAVLCVLLAFAVFNGAVSSHRVLRTAPAALFHAGLVVTVGLALLPASVEDLRRIREVRALRGARTGLRGLPALVVPAVIGGLERSMLLAEAMEARGYAASPAQRRGPQLVGAFSAPLLLGATWGWFYYVQLRPVALASALLGLCALVFWAWSAARQRVVTRLHTEPLNLVDRVSIAFSAAIASLAIAARATGWPELGYNPFAGLEWPPFAFDGLLVALAVAWPSVRLLGSMAHAPSSAPRISGQGEA